jgi:hypothetical protein
MSGTNLVRPSRDGDQFHYLWAARRCLLLISPTASLKAVTIEGPSLSEADAADPIITGEELIDVGEYYGSENLEQATLIRYIQLKHSTLRTDKAWTPSELKKTLKGFAARYMALQQRLGAVNLNGKLEFWFVSNRPINTDFLEAIHDAAEGIPARHVDELKKLERFTSLKDTALASFCKLLQLEGNQEGVWDQQNILAQDISYYLVDADVDAPVQLKELVTKKALSASANNPTITRMDVLRALKTDESRLFPVPCLIKDLENAVSREQEPELLKAIVQASGIPIIVHAAGGVGKSVFATRIKLGLPAGSSSVLYDCFGNGQYRSASGYRHRHKDALVQIANELASKGLCHPLIPSPYAEPSAYVRTFIYSSSGLTAVSARCEATLELGRKLTKELGLDQSVDTLGRWMVHYIAELIQNAEMASAEERPAKMRACCDVILNLWKHRHTLPNGKRPFKELEPLLRTLESLDPEDDTPRYFRSVRAVADDADENEETKSWLKLIDGLDCSARILIRYCLTQAAQNALNKSVEWVGLAEAAGADESIEFSLIRVIAEEDSMLKACDPGEEERKRIEDRIERLEGFAKMSMAVVTDLRQEFQQNKCTRDEA